MKVQKTMKLPFKPSTNNATKMNNLPISLWNIFPSMFNKFKPKAENKHKSSSEYNTSHLKYLKMHIFNP